MMGRQEAAQAPLFLRKLHCSTASISTPTFPPITCFAASTAFSIWTSCTSTSCRTTATPVALRSIDASVVRSDASRQRGVPGSEVAFDRTASLAWPVREYLEALDPAEEPETPLKNVSLTDPAARWTAAPGGPAFYAYSTNYLIDVKAGVIVDIEATPAFRNDEVNLPRRWSIGWGNPLTSSPSI